MLTLFQRGAVWYVRGTVGPTGRKIKVYESTNTPHRNLADAYRAKREAELFESAIFGKRDPVAFRAAAQSYLNFEARSQRTIDYATALTDYFGDTLLDNIGQDQADAAVETIVGTTAAPATKVRVVYTPLIAILNFGAPREWCKPPLIEKPRTPKGKTRWLTPAEAEALIAGAAPHLKPLLTFFLCTGARVSEALDLDWADVHLSALKVMLRDTKNGRDRVAHLPPAAILAIANMPHREGKVFRRDDGEPYADRERWEGGQIKTAFSTALRRAHIVTRTRPHDLRHTFATRFYPLTKDFMLLKDEGRWQTLSMVERYAHLMPPDLVSQIAGVWAGAHPRIGAPGVQPVTLEPKNPVSTTA